MDGAAPSGPASQALIVSTPLLPRLQWAPESCLLKSRFLGPTLWFRVWADPESLHFTRWRWWARGHTVGTTHTASHAASGTSVLRAKPRCQVFQIFLLISGKPQKSWSGQPFPSPGDRPDPGIQPGSPALAGRFLTVWATKEGHLLWTVLLKCKTKPSSIQDGRTSPIFLPSMPYLPREHICSHKPEPLVQDSTLSHNPHPITGIHRYTKTKPN